MPSVTLPMTALHGGQIPVRVKVMRRSAIQTMGFTFGMTVTVRMRRATWCPRRRCRPPGLTGCVQLRPACAVHSTIYSIHTGTCLSRSSPC